MIRARHALCCALAIGALALLSGCSAAGVGEEKVSVSPSGPQPLTKAEKTYITAIRDSYRDIAKVNARILAAALHTRPLPNEAIDALNETLESKAKLVESWNDFTVPSERLGPVTDAWTKVRNDDVKFTGRLVDFVNDASSDKKMEAAVHALGVMGQDWRRCKAAIRKLEAEATGATKSASPTAAASPST